MNQGHFLYLISMKEVIFKLLDILKYNRLEIDDRVYFVKKIGDKYSEIRFDKSDGFCWISYSLISFLSKLTGFEWTEVQELTIKWVEHTLQTEVKSNKLPPNPDAFALNIPYKRR